MYRKDFELYRKYFSDECILHVGLGTTEIPNFLQNFLDKKSNFIGSVVPVGFMPDDIEVSLVDTDGQPVKAGRGRGGRRKKCISVSRLPACA